MENITNEKSIANELLEKFIEFKRKRFPTVIYVNSKLYKALMENVLLSPKFCNVPIKSSETVLSIELE